MKIEWAREWARARRLEHTAKVSIGSPNLLQLGTGLHLKRKNPENLAHSWTQAAPRKAPMACSWLELLSSYFLSTVNQRLVWLFQMYFQTICDCIQSCFRALTCWLIVIHSIRCLPDWTPSPWLLFSYKNLSCWGSRLICLPFASCCIRVGLEESPRLSLQ